MSLKDVFSPFFAWTQFSKKPHTVKHPVEKREAAERYRGFHVNDVDKCIGCGTCATICQNKAIDMVKVEGLELNDGDSGLRPKIDYGRCCWCGLCVDVCTTASLRMTNEYSWVTDNADEYRYVPGIDKKWFDDLEKGYKQSRDMVMLTRERVPMRLMDPKERIKTFAEAVLGYSEEEAIREAYRCVNCGICETICPAHMHIPDYIAAIREKDYAKSVNIMYDNNPLAEACGKFCTRRCETVCAMSHQGDPVAIRWLKRFAVEQFHDLKEVIKVEKQPPKNKRVAIIGGGPSGLTAGYYLAIRGYEVEIFEALPKAGGMIVAGIPKYRFPFDSLDKQLDLIESVGVKIHTNHRVTKEEFAKMYKEYDAVYLATGLHNSMSLRAPGEDLEGVLPAVKFLRDVNFGKKVEIGSKVVVVGGGNVAIDGARVSRRLGAEVIISYRRRLEDMPADDEEIEDAEAEGIVFDTQTIPIRIEKEGKKLAYVFGRAKMVDQGEGKRPKPVMIEGSEERLIVDRVIVAIGQAPDFSFIPEDIFTKFEEKWNKIPVDEYNMTKVKGIFCGGDLTNRRKDAISAIADGLRATVGIDKYLSGK